MGGFIASLSRERSEDEPRDGEEEVGFRWVFEGDVSAVFVAGERGAGASVVAREGFEGTLFSTMGFFALTPHVDTREATLQMLYTVLQV